MFWYLSISNEASWIALAENTYFRFHANEKQGIEWYAMFILYLANIFAYDTYT